MPPRGTRKTASTAVATEPPRSPEPSGAGAKRKPDETQEQSSPLRRSKRAKPVATQSPSGKSTTRAASTRSAAESPKASPRKPRGGKVVSVKKEVEEVQELEVEAEVVDESVAKDEEVDEKPAVKVKATRKRKTKEEVEMVPLRARTQGLRMCVGAHVSAAKGVFNAVHNSTHIGGNAFALFLKSQRKWDNPPLQDDHRDQFRSLCTEHKYDAAQHILPHGSYLVNLAQEDKAKAKQAYDSFLDDLRRCEALGITLYNFHPGSANQSSFPDALTRLATALTNALRATSTVIPVLETMCGHGTTIGGYLHEFRDILAQIPKDLHPRIGICIDTCHSFAAGYDLVTPAGFKAFLQEFDDTIGLQHLRALHLNDSKAPKGSKRDLHANIGTGFLGLRAFHNVMNEPRFQNLPMILETPIDRPEPPSSSSSSSSPKKTTKKPPSSSAKLIPDFTVWAQEIALLESLIGMDPEGEEFRALEAKLSEEGREMREKQQEQYERKLSAEEKKKAKGKGPVEKKKGQKTLMEMMNGAGKTKRGRGKSAKEGDESGSDEEGCQSHAED
ncbi:DNA-(apurinic or apyrimidinic site) lyase APN1 [Aspergillus ibericus CBS 121593]|uniref:Apurinic-apyrimidinic endonuclease 1 n=1 Tax=Aspergillus ibericus CBS 121593 TaxID=1448316 RepID=A0A395H578_9EURO|nr:AP endonuclease [Aspergillus ibericus CBS 121593]RAL01394.1 AP endonuclease [Aspergillus ibericus CBS 121593]